MGRGAADSEDESYKGMGWSGKARPRPQCPSGCNPAGQAGTGEAGAGLCRVGRGQERSRLLGLVGVNLTGRAEMQEVGREADRKSTDHARHCGVPSSSQLSLEATTCLLG